MLEIPGPLSLSVTASFHQCNFDMILIFADFATLDLVGIQGLTVKLSKTERRTFSRINFLDEATSLSDCNEIKV